MTRLELINAKYKTVMESKIIWGRQKSSLEADVAELKLTRTQNHEIMVVYEEIQSKVKSLEAVLREVGTSIQVADGNRLVGLEAKGKHFEKRLSLSIQVSQSNERLAEELKRRVLEVERSYLEAMEEKLEVETRLGELKVKFEGGASGKEHKITVQKLRDVEYALEFGKIETLKCALLLEVVTDLWLSQRFFLQIKKLQSTPRNRPKTLSSCRVSKIRRRVYYGRLSGSFKWRAMTDWLLVSFTSICSTCSSVK